MQVDSSTLAVCLWPPSPLPGVPEPPSVDAIPSSSVTILLDDAPCQQAGTATTLASDTAPAASGTKEAPTRAANGSQSGTGAAAARAAATDGDASATPAAEAAIQGAGGGFCKAASNRFSKLHPPPAPPAAAGQSAATMGHATSLQTIPLDRWGCFLPQYQYCPPRSLSASDLSHTLMLPKQLGLHCYPAADEVGVNVALAVTVPREAACIASEARAASLRTPGCKAAVVAATQAAMAVAGMMSSSRGALQQQGQQQQRPEHGTTLWLQTIWNQQDCRLHCRKGSFSLRHRGAHLIPFADWRLVHCWQVVVGGVGLGYVH